MKNFLTLIGANVPTAAVCTAKSPQNSGGGGSSQCSTSQSIGAQSFTLQSIGAQYFTRFLGSSCRVWKYVACMLMVLVLGIGQMWGTTGDLLDINFTDWYNDGGTTQASGTHYIYTASSGTYKRSNVAYFTNSAYSQSVPSATNYVCVTCSTSTYHVYAKNNTYLSSSDPETYSDSYTVSHNSNTTAPTTVVFTLSSPAIIELLVGASSIGNTSATYGYTAPTANASKVQRAYHFLKTYDYATGSYPLADEIKLKSKDAIAYVTDTTTVAGTVSYEFDAGKLYSASGTNNKKFYIYAIRVTTYSATPAATYTVTLNPNNGSYASTPSGWTASEGNYTKTVSAGALTIPEPTRGSYEFNGWKAGETAVTLTDGKLTVAKDTTLVAQWTAPKATPTVTFNDGNYVVGATALDLSKLFTSENTNAVTFALKVASEDATVSGSGFTATKAGSYVVVATQAADANYKAVSEEATITVTYPATGEATILYKVAVGTGNTALGTASKDDNSASISNLSNFTAAGGLTVSGLGAGKDGLSTKLQTLSSQDYAKYIYVTFDVTGGKEFVLDSISTKIVAVSTAKTIKIVVSDTEGTKDSLDYTQAKNSDAAHHQFNFTSSAKAYAGTVTVKIYAYGATDHYRLAQPLKVCGIVQAALTKYNLTFAKGSESASGSMSTQKYAAGDEVTLPVCTFTAPTGKEFDAWVVTKTVGGASVTVTNGKFTMPAEAVTATATWKARTAHTDATLSDLTIGGTTVTGFSASTTSYNVELPFGTTAAPTVAATANDAEYVKSVVVTQASSATGDATVVVTAEDGTTTKTYTVHFSVEASKDIELVWATDKQRCDNTQPTAVVKSNNEAVSTYINQITFTNVEGDGDDGAEGSSLNVGKKAGNMFTLTAKAGYAFKAMTFFAKINDATCEFSLDGGEWTTLTSTNTSSDACYSDIFSETEVHEFRLRSTATKGVWIRNMQLTMIQACTPKTIAWTTAPASEYEVGKSGYAIAASANNGTVSYAATGDAITVNTSTGALTINSLTNDIDLSASVPAGDGTTYCATPASVVKEEIKTYYLVTFDAQNETATTPVKYYSGDAAIALPSPSYSGYVFQGWFDASTGGTKITEAITPTASRTVYAQWVAECAGPTITTQPASANYFVGRTASALTCEATAGAAGALTYTWYSCDDAERTNPILLAGAPTPSTAAVGTFYYYCTVQEAGCDVVRTSNVAVITVAEKDPVCIIKATPSSATEATADGAYKGSAAITSSGKKLSSKYDYVAVQLMEGKTFLATDKVVLNQTADLSGTDDITKFYVYSEVPADGKTYVTVDNASPVKGDNWFTMPAEMAGESSLYIGRVDAKCNPTVGYLAVYRVMNPELMAITINGRDGVADELVANKFNVTIPYEAVLANLSITKTVAWNAPHATTPATVISNGGAWVIGDNTYRVMDKDGDYTDYTISLTRDVQKHTVSFNTHGGSAVASVEVVHSEKLTAAPADPTKEDYIFQGWAETDGGAIVDVTTFTISANKEFHAVWVSDGAIKLLDGSTVNHTNFITGVTAAKVTISDVEYDYVTFAGGVGADVNNSNIKNLDRLVAYNATTTQTKVKLSLYNSNGSNKRTIYVKGLVEGADASTPLATIELDGGEKRTTEWLEFNNEANRTIYIFVSGNAGDIKILQEKVIESGSALKMAGEAGYSINLNQGRIFGASGATLPFEGMSYTLVGDYTTLSSSVVKLKSTSAVFDVTSPVTLQVTANDKTYYVTKGSAGTDNETAKSGVSEFDLTAGTWYITAGSSEVQISNIAFALPKCAEPAFNALANSELCEGEAFEALDGTATVGDEGTPIYQWYNADGDEAIEGATSAKYTPTATGSYYVIATNQLAGYSDNSKKSTTVTVTRLASTVITGTVNVKGDLGATTQKLSVTATGSGSLTYAWFAYDIVNEETIGAKLSETNELGGLTITEETQYYQVTVTGDCGNVSEILTVSKWIAVEQADVTGSRTWDWNKTSNAAAWAGVADIKLTGADRTTDIIMANTSSAMPNNEHFRSDMLVSNGEYPARPSQDNGVFQGYAIKFHTTVPGVVAVTYRGTGNNEVVKLQINDWADETGISATKDNMPTKKMFVPAGDVTIKEKDGKVLRIDKIVFNAKPDYTRNVSAGNYLTICLPTAGVMTGASIYEIAYYEEASQKIFLDEVMNGVMVADRPYVFQATGSSIGVFYTEEEKVPVEAGNYKGLYGTYTELSTVTAGSSSPLWNKYIISGNQYIHVDANNCILPAYRAYIDMTHVEGSGNMHYAAPAPTPGRRRIAIGGKAPQIATGLEDAAANETPVKVLINGELYILRGEKMYDATGRLVK